MVHKTQTNLKFALIADIFILATVLETNIKTDVMS